MQVLEFTELDPFMARAVPFLVRDEARHNLLLGILSVLRDHPEVYPERKLWLVEDQGEVACVALRTPPHNLALAQRDARAIDALADHLVTAGEVLPGVNAAEPDVDAFVRAWETRASATVTARFRQGIYRLDHTTVVDPYPGYTRVATEADRPFLTRWLEDFVREALPDEPAGGARERILEARLAAGDGAALWLLEEGGDVVSLAGYGGATPNGIRVGPVYTPPEYRRRRYATTLVGEMSNWLLRRGYRCCYLYTDLTNPTSNAIYQRIGYEHVCDAADVRFEERPG